mgnify:FL=1
MPKKVSNDEFIAAWSAMGSSPKAVAEALGEDVRWVYRTRARLAARGVILDSASKTPAIQAANAKYGWQDVGRAYRRENDCHVTDGSVVVFSDAHFWPNQPQSVAHKALLILLKELKPKVVVANGDIFDGARVSRHDPLGWSALPTVKEEVEICEDNLHDIHLAAGPKNCQFFWNVGNHDQRFDKMLASNAADYAGVIPRLEDKFPRWDFAWSLNVNDHTMIKHRYHNGIHAGYNNTLKAGRSIVTGHLHRLLVTPWGDYNGRRWGVDTGTLSDPLSPQFDYGENNPTPHCSGFAVFTFKGGMLLPPELCEVINDHAYFRGSQVS